MFVLETVRTSLTGPSPDSTCSDVPPQPGHGSKDRRRTLGARKILAIIKRDRLNVTKFAERAGVERMSVTRILTGERWRHMDVNFCMAVRAAYPEIALEDFGALTAESVPEDEEEPSRGKTGTDG